LPASTAETDSLPALLMIIRVIQTLLVCVCWPLLVICKLSVELVLGRNIDIKPPNSSQNFAGVGGLQG